MNKIMLFLLVVILTACGKSQPSETVESLAGNPERLKELREQ
ncbi:putative lipoprotein [Pseudomonas syringae pv. antirrhini]|uniref:Putative lipoprotein n=1 Tax=Pseudomonas syringae pv. antirrhini TaxID=251702 RepID=A0A0P9J910_9PSED|nr:putative lipoprotein [Pseudomonas syringae pv. antirrhini]RMP40691.1 putative lipoprotein [Pseudomonas syringae pv. antirrhini]RMP41440.1 putative lipoprotein [Pseudomonas syringae pv. antirrhini]RMW24784.1 putative lipoprotein [Pseudomonas syringae pv. antirrhini]